jgi:hypothetical protein
VCAAVEEMAFPHAYKADGGRGVPAAAFLKGRVVTGAGGTTEWSGLGLDWAREDLTR